MSKRLRHSVAPIIRSAIGIGQYWPLSGVSAICLDFAYRYLVFKHELWVDASDFSSVMNVPKISHYTPKCELKHIIGSAEDIGYCLLVSIGISDY